MCQGHAAEPRLTGHAAESLLTGHVIEYARQYMSLNHAYADKNIDKNEKL